MSHYKYTGPDRELGKHGKVGHTSIIDLTGQEVIDFGGTQFERVSDALPLNNVPYGTVAYVPDVTGLTADEGAQARTAAALIADPGLEARNKKAHDERLAAVQESGHKDGAAPTQADIDAAHRQGLTAEQIAAGEREHLTLLQIRARHNLPAPILPVRRSFPSSQGLPSQPIGTHPVQTLGAHPQAAHPVQTVGTTLK